jgi:[ribosomal protein S5]-alanine N-acetyltransferase
MILFESERLIVRQLEEGDLENFYRLNSDAEVMRYIRKPRTWEECVALIKETIEAHKQTPWLGRHVIIEKSTGHYIGTYSLMQLENTEDYHLGYAFFKEYQGRGFATEITKASIPFVLRSIPKNYIKAITIPENIPSQNVLLKAGFTETGRMIHNGDEVVVFEFKNKR